MSRSLIDMPRHFVDREIAPNADRWDAQGRIDESLVSAMADAGILGVLVPEAYGGSGIDALRLMTLAREIGRGCSSARSLLTVHTMVSHGIARWGSADVKAALLPKLATGESIGALALSEPAAGSDVSAIECTARPDGDGHRITGQKRWITFGQRADLFLLFAKTPVGATAFAVPARTKGLTVSPMAPMMGTRASMVAALRFDDCRVGAETMVGRQGFGLAAVAATALELGRFTVACGSLGILDAVLAGALDHARSRRTFGHRLIDHQLVASKIARMGTDGAAAAELCERAARLRDAHHQDAVKATWMAKYFASTAAFRAACDLVQITAARGCEDGASPQRLMRDAKVMEIIEGSTQIQEITIAGILDGERADAEPPVQSITTGALA
ncbi:acyl-CoA dehydrogenase family protein [Jiella pacifica]|uniref:Acyl-CoA dehydrogenase n=1 Tax=Jiella pacifica TaxID=2696469 RepID=A0A6N9T421_9HYPH|nr:acyl-CoA dehydrogenase family protein [Jiella pacifica]NDW06011.1 acyl-CoA dehydrogenase [Jiella pacifica]